MSAFHEVQFDKKISYRSAGGPSYSSSVIRTDGGAEQRVNRQGFPLRRYNVAYGVKSLDDLTYVLGFYICRDGSVAGFRYKDWLDFTTAANHRGAHSMTDVLVGVGDGVTSVFQLKKLYVSGPVTRSRIIQKPVAGTTLVSLDDVSQGSGWSVNETSGLLTFTTPPAEAKLIKAGCEFDTPVRFGEEVDAAGIQAIIEDFDIGSIEDLPLEEVPPEDAIGPEEFPYRGAQYFSLTGNISITPADGLVLTMSSDQAGRTVSLPDPALLQTGGEYWVIANVGINSINIATILGTQVIAIDPGGAKHIYLGYDSALNKVWIAA